LIEEVLADADFFTGTGGGVTFSGGEPMARPEFLFECARVLRGRGVHVAVETAGFFSTRLAPRLAATADLVLFDLKHADKQKLRASTAKDAANILGNLKAILASKVAVELRLTLVPGFNDSQSDLKTTAAFLRGLPRVPPVTLQAFHRLAVSKQALFDCAYPYADAKPVTRRQLEAAAKTLRAKGIRTV
jgi:pyruvate formate lyase activating enzyme